MKDHRKLPWLAATGTEFSIKNPLGVNDLGGVIQTISNGLLQIAIPIAVVMIVWAGFNLLTAAGNPAKVKRGRDILTWTVVGLAIIFIGGGFVDFIRSILGQ